MPRPQHLQLDHLPSRVTLVSSWSAYLGSQDANHIPKASQTIFPPWMESNMCSPFGTKCLSSVSDLPQMKVHWVPIVLPSFSLQRYSQPKPFLLEQCLGGGHLTEPTWMQGQICVWHPPLLPKLKCHTGNLRRTNEETWTVQWRLYVPSLFSFHGVTSPGSLVFFKDPNPGLTFL